MWIEENEEENLLEWKESLIVANLRSESVAERWRRREREREREREMQTVFGRENRRKLGDWESTDRWWGWDVDRWTVFLRAVTLNGWLKLKKLWMSNFFEIAGDLNPGLIDFLGMGWRSSLKRIPSFT
jgi:hypothetical protein